MTAPTVDPVCLCGDRQSQHRLGKRGCKVPDCGCDRFEPENPDPAVVDVLELRRQAAAPSEPSTSARLREVERELVQLTAQLSEARAEAAGAAHLLSRIEKAADAQSLDPFTDLAEFVGGLRAGRDKAVRDNGSLSSQLAAAEAETAKVRGFLRECSAHGEKVLEQRDAQIARVTDLEIQLEHAKAAAQPVEIYGYDAWLCEACGGRYRPLHDHPCGPLKPVRVYITERQEHHPL